MDTPVQSLEEEIRTQQVIIVEQDRRIELLEYAIQKLERQVAERAITLRLMEASRYFLLEVRVAPNTWRVIRRFDEGHDAVQWIELRRYKSCYRVANSCGEIVYRGR